ncbi:MFS-1 multi-domain protein, partial [Pyrenophora tritici-repentis]
MATSSSVRTMETPTPRITPVNEPDIELDALHPQLHQTHPAEAGFSLPPVDGGKDAWLFLFSAFVLEILTWGFPFAFGIFQEYYSSNPPFAGSRNITLIGTCALGAGTGIGGVIIPLLLQYLLGRYGFRTTLRVWTAVLFVTTLPLTVYVRPRLPIAQVTNRRRLDLSFVRNKSFLLLQLGNVLQGFGYFVPSIYLPTFARTLGASSTVSAVTLILVNVATVFGSLTMGGIVDHWHITTCILLSTVGSTLSVFLLWGFSTNLSLLLVFCAAYGFFAGSYATTYPGIMKVLSKSERTTDSTMVFALLVAGRGIGNVACGPVTEALITVGEIGDRGLYASEYGPLVVFTGISAALGG